MPHRDLCSLVFFIDRTRDFVVLAYLPQSGCCWILPSKEALPILFTRSIKNLSLLNCCRLRYEWGLSFQASVSSYPPPTLQQQQKQISLCFALLQHFVFFLTSLVSWLVPDVPPKVKLAAMQERYQVSSSSANFRLSGKYSRAFRWTRLCWKTRLGRRYPLRNSPALAHLQCACSGVANLTLKLAVLLCLIVKLLYRTCSVATDILSRILMSHVSLTCVFYRMFISFRINSLYTNYFCLRVCLFWTCYITCNGHVSVFYRSDNRFC